MLPIDEFENDLRRTHPRPISPSVIEALEARLQKLQLQQHTAVPPARTSRLILAGVWSSGFAIGAAAMLLVSFWLGSPLQPAAPSIIHTPRQVRDQPSSIAAVEDVTPVETLVSYPAWTPRQRPYRRASEVLTVGSDPSTMFDWPSAAAGVGWIPDHATEFVPGESLPSDATPDRYRSRVPTTRRELIDQILNEV